MTDDTANRMWPALPAGTGVDHASSTCSQEGKMMYDLTADPLHHRTVELLS